MLALLVMQARAVQGEFTKMTIEEATIEINQLPFPHVVEGDIAWYPSPEENGYRFIYQNGVWLHQPE